MNSQCLTVCYQTCRRESKIEWFLDSLRRECAGDLDAVKLVVVDFYANERSHAGLCWDGPAVHVPPKPNVWQGPHRLTKEDYFAAANSRNTGLCHAPDGWIVYVDDLSVLMPGWLRCVRDAMHGHYIVFGSYKKVRNLVVRGGVAVSYDEFHGGIDSRWPQGADGPVPCAGDWLYGCSFAAPVEALLTIGGLPEICDGLGFEDVITGIALQNAGYSFKYDRRMLTLESYEHHGHEKPFKRIDKGKSPNDKSHAVLNLARSSRHFQNYHPGGIRALREMVLAGEPFPICQIPAHDWYDGQPLSEL